MNRKPLPLFVCVALPALVLVGGFGFAGYFGFQQIPSLFEESARGTLPTGFNAELGKAGKYTVWLQVDPEIEEESGRLPPGGKLFVFDASSARELPVTKWVNATRYVADEKSVSLGSFESLRDSQVVEFKGSGLTESVSISISPANTNKKLAIALSLVGIVGGTLMVSIAMFVFLMHRRQKALEEASH